MEIPSIKFGDYPIEWRCTDHEGRYLVASRDLQIGDIVLVARSFLSMESDPLRKQTCHNCLEFQSFSMSGPSSDSSGHSKCSTCNEVYWCSKECHSIGSPIHKRYECQYFRKLRSYKDVKIAADTMTEVKMIIGLLGRYIDLKYKQQEQDQQEQPIYHRPESTPTIEIEKQQYPIIDSQVEDVFQLVENTIDENSNSAACELVDYITTFINRIFTDVLTPKKKIINKNNNSNNKNNIETFDLSTSPKKSIKDSNSNSTILETILASTSLNEIIVDENSLRVKTMLEDVTSKTRSLICKVRCNQFGIWSKRDKCIGVSVIPASSYFNHSCCPNLADIRGTTKVIFKALHNITKGTPLTISYIDLDQPLHERQSYLKTFYYFPCGCYRCKDQTEESDNWISRYYCDKFKCSGTLFLDDKLNDIKDTDIVLTCSYCNFKKSIPKDNLIPPSFVNN